MFCKNAHESQESLQEIQKMSICTPTVGNLSKIWACLLLTLFRQWHGDFCSYVFSLCMSVMRLVQAASVIRAQERNTQGAGDPGWCATTDPFSIWSTFGTQERRNWKFGEPCGMKHYLNDRQVYLPEFWANSSIRQLWRSCHLGKT